MIYIILVMWLATTGIYFILRKAVRDLHVKITGGYGSTKEVRTHYWLSKARTTACIASYAMSFAFGTQLGNYIW